MNGTEQRRQATVAQKLDQTAENLAVLFDALDARVFDLATKGQETRREVNELLAVSRSDGVRLNSLLGAVDTLRSDNLKTHDELWFALRSQIGFLDDQLGSHRRGLLNFRDRTFWGRMRWLFLGR